MALKKAIPVMVSYFFISMAFGVVASKFLGAYSVLMSAMVFAGAAQFIAIRMIQEGHGVLAIVLTVLLVNSRHLLMCSYMFSLYPGLNRLKRLVMAFGITDETFALGISERKRDHRFQIKLNFLSLSSWVSGTAAGLIFGEIVPESFYQVMPFGLTAMFISILVSNIKGNSYIAAAVVAGLISAVAGTGMAVVIASLAGMLAGSVVERWTGS